MEDNACSGTEMQSLFLGNVDFSSPSTCAPGFLLDRLQCGMHFLFCSENHFVFVSEEVSLMPNFQVEEKLIFSPFLNTDYGVSHNCFL